MFVDRIKISAQAGNGGRGCVSFRREKFVPKGGPDGGDGGRGGDVVFKADPHTDNLSALFYEPIAKAKNGGHGQGKKMHGRSAPRKIVKVPVGTVIYPADQTQDNAQAIADLVQPNEEFILCQGGAGGKGNVHFKSSNNRAPVNTPRAKRVSSGAFSARTADDCRCWTGWLSERRQIDVARENFPRHIRKSRPIHSRRFIRSSEWSSWTIIAAPRLPIFPV